jgi:ribosome-associated protein
MQLTEEQLERILSQEISLKTSRSGGKGGQNVNKVESKVEIEFDPSVSASLSPEQAKRILDHLEKKGLETLKVVSSRYRSQLDNREDAAEKLRKFLIKLFSPPRKRIATKPSRSSREKKLQDKKKKSEKKSYRRKLF